MTRSSSSLARNSSRRKRWSPWKDSYGNNNATNLGLLVPRVSPDPALHWLGRGLQFLRARHVGNRSVDRRRGPGLSIDLDLGRRRAALELPLLSLQRDSDVDRLRTLGGNPGVHVHGTG